jgi:hypothetical protein
VFKELRKKPPPFWVVSASPDAGMPTAKRCQYYVFKYTILQKIFCPVNASKFKP